MTCPSSMRSKHGAASGGRSSPPLASTQTGGWASSLKMPRFVTRFSQFLRATHSRLPTKISGDATDSFDRLDDTAVIGVCDEVQSQPGMFPRPSRATVLGCCRSPSNRREHLPLECFGRECGDTAAVLLNRPGASRALLQ